MRGELPEFRKVKRSYAASIIHGVLSGPRGSSLLELVEYDDHHYRAVFSSKNFQSAAGNGLPSKSQWNTLKKRLKRRDRSIFVFRDHGPIECGASLSDPSGATCLYLDFGFLMY